MALTRRNQVLMLVRQAAVGSEPITLPAELQPEWDALVAKYLAQTQAKRRQWRNQVATQQKESMAADLAALPAALLVQAVAQFQADADAEAV